MTTHFIDIRILPDPEFGQFILLGALFSKLHRALVDLNSNDIGVSFPDYSLRPRSLGQVLRLHGTDAALERLMGTSWLHGMWDHTSVSQQQKVPDNAEHCQFVRRQFKTNVERLRRRRMRRKGETVEEACQAIPDDVAREPELPYVQLRSLSTGQPFCLFLERVKPCLEPTEGEFNTYGLSRTATVPWF